MTDPKIESNLTIALDAMGGDRAPDVVIDGAALALNWRPNLRFLIFGNRNIVEPIIKRHKNLGAASEFRHTEHLVKSTDKPSQALRQGRQSSMRLAIDSVAEGVAEGVVSAGNTGALMAMSKFVLKTVPGIDRPAISSFLPTVREECVMLDLGANIDCDQYNLVQFAIIGAAFARIVLGKTNPMVGLLNVGEEELKGNEAVKAAAAVLRELDLPLQFQGFVEGDDIAAGVADVIVTDGFTGNIAVKVMEGTAKLYGAYLREAMSSNIFARLGYLLAKPTLRSLTESLDPRRYNGGIFLGLNGVSVKSHGGTDHIGFAHAVSLAANVAEDDLIGKISADLKRFSDVESLYHTAAVS